MTEETGRYRTPGELIQAAREGANLSLGDLSTRTRIPEHVLGSLESDDYDALSGPLYVRSFLKTLAAELNMDAEQLLERYDHLAAPEEPVTETGEPTWETETRVERVGGPPWGRIGLGAAAVLVLTLIVWGGISLFGGGDDEVVSAVDPSATEATEAEPDAVQVGQEEQGDAEAPVESTPDSIPVVDDAEEQDDAAPSVLPASIPAGTERMVFSDGARFPLVLRLVCSDPIGAAVAVDADASLHGVDWRSARTGVPEDGIETGQPYRVGGRYVVYWGAQDHFVVRLEESDGVELTLNGQPKAVRQRNLGREWVLDATRLRN